jgi:hypothetical protein
MHEQSPWNRRVRPSFRGRPHAEQTQRDARARAMASRAPARRARDRACSRLLRSSASMLCRWVWTAKHRRWTRCPATSTPVLRRMGFEQIAQAGSASGVTSGPPPGSWLSAGSPGHAYADLRATLLRLSRFALDDQRGEDGRGRRGLGLPTVGNQLRHPAWRGWPEGRVNLASHEAACHGRRHSVKVGPATLGLASARRRQATGTRIAPGE